MSIRRAVAAAAAGVMLFLAGAVMAGPAHADVGDVLCEAANAVSPHAVPALCSE
ncbi:hypothetical protein ABZ410_05310 [Streptomyces cinnamoneus]|uniref:hypothetical protein n=1 Tax=Streptomyces cinnamoneus TaxID=53446 RepID=UPI0033C0D1E0